MCQVSNVVLETEDQIVYLSKKVTQEGQTRVCEKCGETKQLSTSFSYHRTNNCFSRKCLDCINKDRRETHKNAEKKCAKPEDGSKICPQCNIDKPLYTDYIFHSTQGFYYRICKECKNENDRNKRKGIIFVEDNKQVVDEGYGIREKSIAVTSRYKTFDRGRGLENDLTRGFVELKLREKCVYCGSPSTGLDRKDNKKGHLIDNCVPCCWTCNTVRMDNFSHEEMFELGETIKNIKQKRKE